MRRRKTRFKVGLVGILVLTTVAFAGAFAMAQPGSPPGLTAPSAAGPATPTTRAAAAAGALADAHPSDRAVAYLSTMAQREIARAAAANAQGDVQTLDSFSQRAEQHLLSGTNNPAEAQELLRGLVQQLQGTSAAGLSPAAAPTPATEAEPSEVSVFGEDVEIEAGRTVESASVVGGNLLVRGHVLQDAVAVGGNVHVAPGARVGGDSVAVGGNVQLDPGTRVEGDAVSVGGRSTIAAGAYVGGERTQVGAGTWTRPLASEGSRSGGFARWLKSTAETIGFGLVMALLFVVIAAVAPNRTRNVVGTIRRKPIATFFTGILAFVVMVMATVVLAITVIGIPLIPVLWIGGALAMLFGMASVSALVGEALPGKNRAGRTALRAILLGVLFLTIVSFIPFGLGWIIHTVLMSAALGAVIVSRIGAVDAR